MPSPEQQPARTVLTAYLTTGSVRAARTMRDCVALIEEILTLGHAKKETRLWVGNQEFHRDKNGPFPNHLMRISVEPSTGCAALSYTDHDDPDHSVVMSFNSGLELPKTHLIFNGESGDMFPQSAVIPIADARAALLEWLRTRSLSTNVNWRPFGQN